MRRLIIVLTSILLAATGLVSIAPANASTYDGVNGTVNCSGGGSVLIEGNIVIARQEWQPMYFMGEDYGYWRTLPSDCAGSLELPLGVTSIGNEALSGANSLTSVTIPATVSVINEEAFKGTSSLTSISLPQGVTAIGQSAFASSGLTSVSIPEGVTFIGNYAFYSARSLATASIPSTVTNIGYRAFAWNTALTSITVHPSNSNYASISGVLFNKNQTNLITYPANRSASSYVIPDGVQAIEFAAFDHAKNITSVTIPATVTVLGAYAFSGSALTSVYFLGNAPSAQSDAFMEVPIGATGYILSGATGFPAVGSSWNGLTISQTVNPPAIDENIPLISSGALHTCAILDGGVSCWGAGWWGQLGDGTNNVRPFPVVAIPSGSGVTAVASGYSHSCAVVNGGVKCWGENYRGKLGNGSGTDSNVPVVAIPAESGATAVSAGGNQTCAVVNGGVKCWGEGIDYVPTTMIAAGSGVTQVSISSAHTCVVVSGSVQCWGSNGYGQFGNGQLNETYTTTPVSSFVGVSGVTQVSAGVEQTCVVADGGLWCAGYNGAGQLGNGNTNLSAIPINTIPANSGVTSVALNLGNMVCAAIAGGVKCWGQNWGGIGNGSTSSTTPVTVIAAASGVTDVSVSMRHGCGLGDSLLKCWGWNEEGELGNGAYVSRSTPVSVLGVFTTTVNVTYSLSGGAGNAPTQPEVVSGSSFVVAGSPSRSGYTFEGWSDGVALFQPGSNYSVGESAVTLTAIWSQSSYSVTFSSTGGSAVPSISFVSGGSLSAPTPPTRAGYTFAGWSASEGGSAVTFPYAPNVFENVTLYALWTVSTYIVRFNYASADGGNAISTAAFTAGGNAIKLPRPIKNGYNFAGWYADADLTSKIGDAGTSYSPTGIVYSVEIYAKWVKKTFTRLVPPVINGKATVGSLLTASVSSFGSGTTYSYEWLRDGMAIGGATKRNYVLTPADLNTSITFRVCGTKPWIDTACLVSNASEVSLGELRRNPQVGLKWTSLKVGATIVGKPGSWDAGVNLTYLWLRDGVEIDGATQYNYIVTSADRGHTLTFKVLAQKSGYKDVIKTSVPKLIP